MKLEILSGLTWVIIRPPICGTGHVSRVVGWVKVVLGVFRVIFLLLIGIHVAFPSTHPRPPPLRVVEMTFVDDFFQSLTSRPSFNSPFFQPTLSASRYGSRV